MVRLRRLLFLGLFVLVLVCGGYIAAAVLETEPIPDFKLPAKHTPVATKTVSPVPFVGPPRGLDMCSRILAIDGGGVRGVVSAMILERIEQMTGKPIAKQFDLIAGTSTGAIIALGLARPSNEDRYKPAFAAADLAKLYVDHAAVIFPNPNTILAKLRRVFRPKHATRGLSSVLDTYFEDVEMIEALTNVLVPAYDIEQNDRVWFSTGRILMKYVVRGATAAPTYLPPARFVVPNEFDARQYVAVVDGALFANNPSLAAIQFNGNALHADIDKSNKSVFLLSLGTTQRDAKYTFEEAWRWGMLGWVDPLFQIAYGDLGTAKAAQTTVEFGGGHYVRLELSTPVDLDDSSPTAVAQLKKEAAEMLDREEIRLKFIVNMLARPRPADCAYRIGVNYERPLGPRKPAKQ